MSSVKADAHKGFAPGPRWKKILRAPMYRLVLKAMISHATDLAVLLLLWLEHAWSGMHDNFGRFSIVWSVCLSDDNFRKPSRKFIFAYLGQVRIWRSSGQGQGHRSKKGPKCLFPHIQYVSRRYRLSRYIIIIITSHGEDGSRPQGPLGVITPK